jgi:hypothetical protein
LRWSVPEVRRSSYLNILRIEDVFNPVHLLDPSVVDRNPDRLLVSLEDSSFQFDTLSLNVLVSFNIDLANNGLTLNECCLVEGYPDLTFGWNQMVE